MTCNFSTYQTNLSPSRNALVDGLETYLASDCEARYSNNAFQYLKMGMDIDVVVPLGQDEVVKNEFGNYARIVIDDRIWYYFITKCEWVNKDCAKLTLSIDSINTFRNDLEWAPQTTIERQHMDRMVLTTDDKLYRIIDREPEEIPVVKHIVGKTKLLQNNQDINWYLIYDSEFNASGEDTSKPVRCRCIADQALTVYKSTAIGPAETWTSSDIGSGQYYYMNLTDNDLITLNLYLPVRNVSQENWQNIDVSTGTEIVVDGPLRWVNIHGTNIPYYTYWRGIVDGFRVSAYNGNVRVALALRDVQSGESVSWRPNGLHMPTVYNTAPDFTNGGLYYDFSSIVVKQLAYYRFSTRSDLPISYSAYVISDADKVNAGIGSLITRTTIPFSDVDRTDSRLIKIINLPYAPCTISYDSDTGVYTFPSDWTYENGYMRLNDINLNAELHSKVSDINLTNLLVNGLDTAAQRLATNTRNNRRESKLYNSQFYTCKLVYDSFSLDVALENFDYSETDELGGYTATDPLTFEVTFKPSNTMNSHFAFFADLDKLVENNPNFGQGHVYYWHHGDFDEYMITTRNNEESVFSSAYLDYIRNGYNYDKKVKAEQNTWNLAMGGLQMAGAIVSFAAGAVTGGVSVAAGVALATSAITTFAGAARNDQVAKDQMAQKLKELALQGVNISGADDIDLLKFYSGNKAYWIQYQPDEYQLTALADLFHYCGYKHARHEVPNITSRYWFNFIQCAPVFKHEDTFVWNNYLDDIRTRYRAGVTVYHRHVGVLTGMNYDWDQSHENWEVGLVEGGIEATVSIVAHENYDTYTVNGNVINPKANDMVDIEWYWSFSSWADKDPDETTTTAVNASTGAFSDYNNMQGGIAIRARTRNTGTGEYGPWYTIWNVSTIVAYVTVELTDYYEQYYVNGIVVHPHANDVVDMEWYWDEESWADKDPDDTTVSAVNALTGAFTEDNRMQYGVAIRARVRNTSSSVTTPWYTIWES